MTTKASLEFASRIEQSLGKRQRLDLAWNICHADCAPRGSIEREWFDAAVVPDVADDGPCAIFRTPLLPPFRKHTHPLYVLSGGRPEKTLQTQTLD